MTTNLPAIVSLSDMERMAVAVAKSQLFGVKTADQALALMLVAQAEGMHPATAMMQFDIIQDRPARKSWAMLERFQSAGGKVEWTDRTDERVAATFSHPQGGSVAIDWDMERARKAGLGGRDNWKKWPRQMLTARVISEGVRTVFPGAGGGFYAPEEVQDFGEKARDVTPPKPKSDAKVVKKMMDTFDAEMATAKAEMGVYDPETGEVIDSTPAAETDWTEWSRSAKLDIDRAATVEALDDWCDTNADTLSALTVAKRAWGEKLERIISDKRDALRSAAA